MSIPGAALDIATGASLSIRATIGDGCKLVFKTGERVVEVNSGFGATHLAAERKRLRESLVAVGTELSAGQPRHWDAITEAMRILHFRGKTILLDLIPDADQRLEISEMFRWALGRQLRPRWDVRAKAPRMIDVHTNIGHGIPFDMLPLVNLTSPGRIRNHEELAAAASSFLGFSAILKRTIAPNVGGGTRLKIDNDPRLKLRVFCDATLGASAASLDFFNAHGDHFATDGGAWPSTGDPSTEREFLKALVDRLWASSAQRRQGFAPDICYFVCHTETDKAHPEDYLIHLRTDAFWGRGKRSVKLGELRHALHAAREAAGRGSTPEGPLVFFNTCGSADLDPFAAASLPMLFTEKTFGFLGFIGTETTIPDWFGGKFAEVFYRHFIGGKRLGDALHATRWHMLRHFRDPFGLMYTLYADPEIETQRKVPELLAAVPLPRPSGHQ